MQFTLLFGVYNLQISTDDQTESLQRAVEINAVRSWLPPAVLMEDKAKTKRGHHWKGLNASGQSNSLRRLGEAWPLIFLPCMRSGRYGRIAVRIGTGFAVAGLKSDRAH